MHQSCPSPKDGCIHGKDFVGPRHFVGPSFDFRGSTRILISGQLDARLNFPQGHRRQAQQSVIDRLKPRQHRAMRANAPQFGDNICIEQVHAAINRSAAPACGDAGRAAEA